MLMIVAWKTQLQEKHGAAGIYGEPERLQTGRCPSTARAINLSMALCGWTGAGGDPCHTHKRQKGKLSG
jgi:hypothetical protein